MKKQILFSTLLFFSAMHGMDKPAKQRKLLFPFPGKSLNDLWQMVRKDYETYTFFGEELPQETKQKIARFLFLLNNPRSFSTPQDQFFRKLLGCCSILSCKEKEWKFPVFTKATKDGRYYIYDEIPQRNNAIKIYDRANKKTIELQCDNYPRCNLLQIELLLKKNVIVFVRDEELLLYDIEKDKEYCYRDIFALSCNGKFWVSENERYVCVRDQDSYCVLDITSLDDIKRYPFDIGDETIEAVTFSSDDSYFACSLKSQTVGLWTINNHGLTQEAVCDAVVWGLSEIQFTHNNEYIVFSVIRSPSYIQSIKVEKNNEGSVSLKKSFYADYRMWGMFKDVLIADDMKKKLMIMDGTGHIRYTFQEVWHSSNSTRNPKHIFQRKSNGNMAISRLLHDEKGYYRGIQQDTIISSDMGIFMNAQETIMQKDDFSSCWYTDLNGRLLGQMARGFYSQFNSHGNVVLQQNSGHFKKLTFHPQGADNHFEELAHKLLKFEQFAALEKVCSEVEKHRLSLTQSKNESTQ